MSVPDNENLKGLKEVSSWFIDDQSKQDKIIQKKSAGLNSQKESRRSRKNRMEEIFNSLPKPPKLLYKKRSRIQNKVYKRQIKASWENTLNETQLKQWKTLSVSEQHKYLFFSGGKEVDMIKRAAQKTDDKHWWNSKKTDWDVT